MDDALRWPRAALSRRQFLISASAAGVTSGLRVGRASAEDTSGPRRGGVLRVSHYSNPSSLDPATGRGGSEQTILWTIFDTLVP